MADGTKGMFDEDSKVRSIVTDVTKLFSRSNDQDDEE